MDGEFSQEKAVRTTKFIHEGEYAAEVEVELRDSETWTRSSTAAKNASMSR